ncbi:hypothetical protein ACFP3T_08380 [Lactiplantibacillus dongliensis]|uniref:Lipoprotein n=1 Tax=Lactiplantibacillus dongliensis TaxID=2559919 RepID=A0ABW1R489_9LACO|nr:hypothetical protein [Lactiplantibacillus dongliensis]
MRRKLNAGLLVLAIIVLLLSSITKRSSAAVTTMTLADFPVSWQRTWYHYDDNGAYDTVTFKTHQFRAVERQSGTTYQHRLQVHQRVLGLNPSQLVRHPTWAVARQRVMSGVNWLNVRSWNQLLGTGWDFKVSQQRLMGQSVTILSQTSSCGTWAYEHYFTSQQLARRYHDMHFPGEVYGTSY